jgi:hypothetical protein
MGVRFEEILQYCWGAFTIRTKGSWAYQKTFHAGSVTAALVGIPSFLTLATLTNAQNLGVVAWEFLLTPWSRKYPRGSIAYQGEFGSKYLSHEVFATLALDF